MKRRDFLRTSAGAAAGLAIPYFVPSRVLGGGGKKGPNEKFQIGFVGLGGRASALILTENILSHANIVATADCDLSKLDAISKKLEEKAPGAGGFNRYQDYRQMLEKEKLDAVFIATTTHARALICLHALEAGLHVYAEKPLTLTIAEGRVLVNAARKHKRILQTGTQQRSMPINMYASKLVREGAIGKVHSVITYNFEGARAWDPKPAQAIPEGLNWDMWCNQTELRPYHPELQRQWGLWPEYDGGGQSWGVTGWGTHSLDQVQCALGTDDTGPVELWMEEPGPQGRVTLRYANGTLLKLEGPKRQYEDLGAIFVGDKGKIEIIRGSATSDPKELLKDAPPDYPSVRPGETYAHIDNFFECVQTGKLPNADVEIAHRTTTVCHLINICRALGRKLQWDPKAEKFVGDDEANKHLSRPRRKGYELPGLAV